MVVFLIMDLGLNSSLDFDTFNNDLGKNFLLGLLGLQIVIQISVFLILFLAAADTFLFRVGLLGILIRTVRYVLILHPIYMAFTIAEGVYRVQKLSSRMQLSVLWSDETFIALAYIHKIGTCSFNLLVIMRLIFACAVAIPYYILNIRMTVTLEDPIYFNKDAWISLIKQVSTRYCLIICTEITLLRSKRDCIKKQTSHNKDSDF